MSLRPKNKNRPQFKPLPVIDRAKSSSNIQEAINIISGELSRDFGETDLTNIKEFETEINSFYKDHPELNANSIETNAWIQTFTGKKFYPRHPSLDSICIEDIAHSLANQCRFTGHTKEFYSIAQHSILVSYFCNNENSLYGLLHDGNEAFTGDLASPTKKLPEMKGFRQIEKAIQRAICQKFNLPIEEPKDVKQADLLVLGIEAQTLMHPLHLDWKFSIKPPPIKIIPLAPKEAKMLFLERFEELYKLR